VCWGLNFYYASIWRRNLFEKNAQSRDDEAMVFATLLAICLKIGGATLDAEVADTPSARERGLMDRSSLSENTGMLFIFDTPQILSFWMKNTKVPLSIGFFDAQRHLLEIIDMALPDPQATQLPIYRSSSLAQYALEVPLHWFQNHRISPGMDLHIGCVSNAD
jgi:uncharacterized membrane protein (UPF0127 family)